MKVIRTYAAQTGMYGVVNVGNDTEQTEYCLIVVWVEMLNEATNETSIIGVSADDLNKTSADWHSYEDYTTRVPRDSEHVYR